MVGTHHPHHRNWRVSLPASPGDGEGQRGRVAKSAGRHKASLATCTFQVARPLSVEFRLYSINAENAASPSAMQRKRPAMVNGKFTPKKALAYAGITTLTIAIIFLIGAMEILWQ